MRQGERATRAEIAYRIRSHSRLGQVLSPWRRIGASGIASLFYAMKKKRLGSMRKPLGCWCIATLLWLIYPGGRSQAALPDLTIYAPATFPSIIYRAFASNDCTVSEGCIPAGIRRLLSFTTETRNVGAADLVMGNPATNSLFVFDSCHGHYHFVGFAAYRLRDNNQNLVAQGRKIGFCLEDVHAWDPNANPTRLYDCDYQGIQKGWADVYVDEVPCQWIDVTGIPAGNYILEIETNPDHSIAESDYSNNLVQIPVAIPEECRPLLANDDFSNPQIISSVPSSVTTFNACATKEPGEPNHAGDYGGHSIWFQFTPTLSGTVVVSTEGSDFDTLLAVYTGNAVDALTMIATNDDIITPDIPQSRLSFQATAGTAYHIAVDGYGGVFGMVVLNMNPPSNDAFASCKTLSGVSGQTNGYTIGATKQAGEPDHNSEFWGHSIWYCWTAPSNAKESFDTVGSSFDTLLAIYTGNSVSNLTRIASDNDSGGNLTSRTSFQPVAGRTYHIAVDGVAGATGNVSLHWRPATFLSVQKLSSTSYRLTLTGASGSYSLQGSTNLQQWTSITTLTLSSSSVQYTDNAAGSFARRFYRAVLP